MKIKTNQSESEMKNKWDERYSQSDYYYGTLPNSFLHEHISVFKPGARLLCLAEGEGRNAAFLAEQGFQVTAVDASQIGLHKLEKLAAKAGVHVETICSDLKDFDMGTNEWDGIISIWCHLPSQLRKQVHASAKAGLREGGIFMLESYTPEQLKFRTGGPSDVDFLTTLAQLEPDFKDFEIEFRSEATRNISEGIGHQGVSAVVQFIARKKSK